MRNRDGVCKLCGSENIRIKRRIDVSDKSLKYYLFARNIRLKEEMTGIYEIGECRDCGLIFVLNPLSDELLNVLYESNSNLGGNWQDYPYLFNVLYDDDMQSNENYYTSDMLCNGEMWKLDLLNSYFSGSEKKRSELRILDVGCGHGGFLKVAEEAGYDVYGCDLSDERVDYAAGVLKVENVYCGKADNLFSSSEKFDLITLWDVIEHLREPVEELKRIAALLKPGGAVMILTMNSDSLYSRIFGGQWRYTDPVGHLFYFTDRSMNRLLTEAGLKPGPIYDDVRVRKSRNFIFKDFMKRLKAGLLNRFFFYCYRNALLYRLIGRRIKVFPGEMISKERMEKRLENLCPYLMSSTYDDNRIYTGIKGVE